MDDYSSALWKGQAGGREGFPKWRVQVSLIVWTSRAGKLLHVTDRDGKHHELPGVIDLRVKKDEAGEVW